jgi:peptidoglycan/xylan/chitin deacetylase (PgdA/CDA1 family)
VSATPVAALGIVLTAALRLVGVLLYRLRLHGAVMRLRRGEPRVLLYHACEESESSFTAGLGSNTTPAALAAHLDFLARHYRVVSLDDLVSRRHGEGAVVITFDDGYRSVYRNAFPMLVARRMPAVVYLVGAAIDNRSLVWVNELNWLLRRHGETARPIAAEALGMPSTSPADALVEQAVSQYSPALVASLLDRLRRAADVDPAALARETGLYLSRSEIAEMRSAGIAFGNHTATHPNLARLDPEAQEAEVRDGHLAVVDVAGACGSFAHPFGAIGPAARRAAQFMGYASAMEVGGDNAPLRLHRIARVPVFATDDAGLFAEIEIVAPVKAALRRLAVRPAALLTRFAGAGRSGTPPRVTRAIAPD